MSSTFELGPEDAALIIRADGTMDILIPEQEDDEPAFPASVVVTKLAYVAASPALAEVDLSEFEDPEDSLLDDELDEPEKLN